MKPVIATIAGSDSSGGAGIQADMKTIAALGGWPVTVVTAVTAQDETGVREAVTMETGILRAQLNAAFGDDRVAAAKTGMLSARHVVEEVAAALREWRPRHVVCDPVLRAGGGTRLLEDDAIETMLRQLLPCVSLITPNVPEAERLTGMPVRTVEDAARAGRHLRELGAGAALVTGGHLDGAPGTDVLAAAEGTRVFEGEWIETGRVHGTGCVLSAALAALLGSGATLDEAVTRARAFVRSAIHAAPPLGPGGRSVEPCHGQEMP